MIAREFSRVLVVDDHEYSCRLISHALGQSGWTVTGAGTIAHARELVSELRPAVILLDLQLPDGSGVDLAKSIRSDDERRDQVIVACTAGYGPEEQARALAAGCDAYLTKPIDVAALPDLIASLLAMRADEDAVSPVGPGREPRGRDLASR